MLDTHGVRDPPIFERLTLSHHIGPTFGFAPGTGYDHGRRVAALEGPTRERFTNNDLRFQISCKYFKYTRYLVEPTRRGAALSLRSADADERVAECRQTRVYIGLGPALVEPAVVVVGGPSTLTRLPPFAVTSIEHDPNVGFLGELPQQVRIEVGLLAGDDEQVGH